LTDDGRACGADDDVGVLLRQIFKQLRFQMIDDNYSNTMQPKDSRGERIAGDKAIFHQLTKTGLK